MYDSLSQYKLHHTVCMIVSASINYTTLHHAVLYDSLSQCKLHHAVCIIVSASINYTTLYV